jgi:alpha-glucosidase
MFERPLSRRAVLGLGAGAVLWAGMPAVAAGAAPDTADDEGFPQGETYRVGGFVVQVATWSGAAALRVAHVTEPDRALFESVPGRGFLAAGVAETSVEENTTPASGFTLTDVDLVRFDRQTVDEVRIDEGTATLHGSVSGEQRAVGYTMTFSEPVPNQLRFEVVLTAPAGTPPCTRVFLHYRSAPDEHFFGFGQQLTYFDQKSRLLPVLVQEHGVGRGLPVVTQAVELAYGARTAGAWYTTEVSVPHYLTTQLRSLFLENTEYCVFDLRAADRAEIELFAGGMSGRILHGRSPLDLIESYTQYAGRMRPLPDWVHEGAIVAVQGGTDRAMAKLQALVAADVPVAAFWIQDWVGQRTTPVGSQLWWDWQLDQTHYPNWQQLVDALREQRDARMLIYINPFLADQPGHDQLYQQALLSGYLVRGADGQPILIPNASFSAGLIDLSNDDARTWIKGIIKDRLIDQAGASGWMADFGEALPFNAVLASGESPDAWHNRYPEEWARVNREAIEEAGQGNDAVFFNRSGYTRSPGISTLFWLGDQLQTWDEHDGMRSAITGALSGGVSGFSLVHSDTGGFDSLSLPLPGGNSIPVVRRTKELLQRWMELNAFTPVFRTHEGIDPAVAWQYDSDQETLAHFRRCVQLYRAWGDLRRELVAEAATTGHPVMRHLVLHHPDDAQVLGLSHQYLLGPDLLIAPVVEPGATTAHLYLPAGHWRHLWTDAFRDDPAGGWIDVPAPIGQPPVFLRAGSPAETSMRTALDAAGIA